jgi:hypothetical protein
VTHGGQVGASFGVASAPIITDCTTGAGTGLPTRPSHEGRIAW